MTYLLRVWDRRYVNVLFPPLYFTLFHFILFLIFIPLPSMFHSPRTLAQTVQETKEQTVLWLLTPQTPGVGGSGMPDGVSDGHADGYGVSVWGTGCGLRETRFRVRDSCRLKVTTTTTTRGVDDQNWRVRKRFPSIERVWNGRYPHRFHTLLLLTCLPALRNLEIVLFIDLAAKHNRFV